MACDSAHTVEFSYIHDSHRTLVNWLVDFEIACWSNEALSSLTTILFAGYLVSSLFFVALADIVGRRPIIFCGLVLHLVLNVILNFVFEEGYLLTYMVLFGIRGPMAGQVAMMLYIEFISPEKRGYFSILSASIDGLINILAVLCYKYLQDWKWWFLFNDIEVALLLILFFFFVAESPRYYISRN